VTGVSVRSVRDDPSIRSSKDLIEEYALSLGFSLDFQDFDTELRTLPGQYAPPDGELLLASAEGHDAGCVALRRFDGRACEMKRLFVRPAYRGRSVGRILVSEILGVGRRLGYHAMLLDTVPSMTAAIELYRSFGFVDIAPYRYNPIPGAVFLRLDLG
jgi:putative acetyltransferase